MALTHLDAGALIGFLDADDAHHRAARAAIGEALERNERLAMAASAFAECLVGPARRGEDAVGLVQELRTRLPVAIIDLNIEIATTAARLRAHHRILRLPDALVIATASIDSADRLVTTDRRWPDERALGITTTITTL